MIASVRRTMKIAVSVLFTSITVLAVVASVYIVYCQRNNKIAYVFDHSLIVIVTPSMEPEIPTDSYIHIEKISADEVATGDVIVFYSRDEYIRGYLNTHRVKEIGTDESGKRYFITKGDNNAVEDNARVYDEDIAGRYIETLPVLTKILGFAQNSAVMLLLVLVPSLNIIAFCLYNMRRNIKKKKMDEAVAAEVERLKREGLPPEAVAETGHEDKTIVGGQNDAQEVKDQEGNPED